MPNKSSSADFVPTSLLKSCSAVFSEVIARLANLSFRQGCFPQSFKQAHISPLLKKPHLDPNDLSNYRPISNLNNISKILERLFLSRLRPHILSSPHFNPFQSAYRKNHSTETALLSTLDDIFYSSDTGKSSLLVSLDLSSAFDTIDHNLLIDRLRVSFGVTGPVLDWISSYLSSRTQLVKINEYCSTSQPCPFGVPQGSVLGPLLFTIYVSPIASFLSSLGVRQHQYADDTQLYVEISRSDTVTCLRSLESALSTLSSWFSHNWLSLNPIKSESILLGTSQRNKTLDLPNGPCIAGTIVPLSSQIKLLGVTLDNSLTFRQHSNRTSQSCYYHIKSLRHIRQTLDTHTATLLAHSLVSSKLDYANSVLYRSPSSVILKYQRIQNALARIVLQADSRSHSSSLLRKLHWLPIHCRIHFKLATLTYKALSTGEPNYLAILFQHYKPTRDLRSSNCCLLQPPASGHLTPRTAFGSRAFRFAAPEIWNRLPHNLKTASSLSIFKHNLKTHYFRCPPPA
jgi:hypothetical protein